MNAGLIVNYSDSISSKFMMFITNSFLVSGMTIASSFSTAVSKADFKNLFQSSIKEMLTKREKQKKEKDSTDMD
jgi:hypothetical protein